MPEPICYVTSGAGSDFLKPKIAPLARLIFCLRIMFRPESSNIPKLIVSHTPLPSCDVFKDTFVDLVYLGDYRANDHPTYRIHPSKLRKEPVQ
jgi:hypothetical protein